MKNLSYLLLFLLVPILANAQNLTDNKINPSKKVYLVETSCGQCNFGLKKKGCDLAIRKEGKVYLVKGTSIDAHGDAHAKDGFCNSIRLAKVQGEIKNNIFEVTYFELQNNTN